MAPGPHFSEALVRSWDDRDAVLPLDLRLSKRAIAKIVESLRPSVILEAPGQSISLAGGEPVEDGDALVVATSGTTGEPKGVVLTHGAVEASARAVSARLGVEPSKDRWLACLPLAHVGGLSVVTRALVTGTPVEIQPRFVVEDVLDAALKRGATLVSLVPAALARLGPEGAALFRAIVVGGQQPPAEREANTFATYGMTETGSGVVYDGVPLQEVEVSIQAGEVWLRCPMLLRCYRDRTDPKTSDGWLATGDAGRLDDDGRLQILGRLDDAVISGGENIWPAQVEQVLRHHSSVLDVAVDGLPDAEWGARLVAYVVPSPDAQGIDTAVFLARLREFVTENLAPFAAPRELVVVAALPRTAIGKVIRAELPALNGPRALAD
jgi:O-succinylbenzoic acid--CoA ligase